LSAAPHYDARTPRIERSTAPTGKSVLLSGCWTAAQLMRVTEEPDAMRVLGIAKG